MRVGVARVPVVFRKKGLPLYGYGRLSHRAAGAETDLFARAFVFESGSKRNAILILETYTVSHHLKKDIIARCYVLNADAGLTDANVLCCGQNTHSAPGGTSHYAMMNLSCGGFVPSVFEAYAEAGAEALLKACDDLEEASLYLNAGEFAEDADVAFNRNLDAYNRNPEVQQRDENTTHLATDRLMKQLHIASADGTHKGVINWFGVQGTSISPENTRIHSDNKGYAASLLEHDQADQPNFVAGFACEACADISPNHHGRAKWWPRGKFEDEFKSAYFNGFLQFEKSKHLLEVADEQIALNDTIDFEQQYFNLSAVGCAPDFTPDHKPHACGQAAAGLALLDGTPVDNPGLDTVSTTLIASWVKYRNVLRTLPIFVRKSSRSEFTKLTEAHGPKKILAELHENRILGFRNLNRLRLPLPLSDIGEELKRQYNAGGLKEHTWFPAIIPLQILIIGDVAIVAFPGEITTIAATRLKKSILAKLLNRGILDVIICQNANEYSGYTTTFEEYQEPSYLRGMNFFGQYTLAAMQTAFNSICINLLKPEVLRQSEGTIRPPDFSDTELKARTIEQRSMS